jgi:hypothetical protein
VVEACRLDLHLAGDAALSRRRHRDQPDRAKDVFNLLYPLGIGGPGTIDHQ